MSCNNKQHYFNLILLNSLKNVFKVGDSDFFVMNSVEIYHSIHNYIREEIVRVLTLLLVKYGFEPKSGQTRDYKMGIFR